MALIIEGTHRFFNPARDLCAQTLVQIQPRDAADSRFQTN